MCITLLRSFCRNTEKRMADWDCIVVGAGIIGSWTAYHVASSGMKTLMIDQFIIPHTRGSSGGQSRLIRKAYNQAYYAEMMPEAYSWWEKLEKDSGQHLFRKTGLLMIQQQNQQELVNERQQVMDHFNMTNTVLTPSELKTRYPALAGTNQHIGLLDPDAGILLSSRCLFAIQNEFKKKGGKIQDGEKVENIILDTPVTIITSMRHYTATKVIIAAGPWSNDILAKTGIELPIKTMPGLSVFFQEQNPSKPKFNVDSGFPILYTYLYSASGVYRFVVVFPSLEYPGMVKIVTRGEPPAYYCHPDERDLRGHQDLIKILVQFVKERLPGLDPTPRIMEPCMYSMTPDRDFIVDRHPLCKNVLIAAGFSGLGYMTAPVVGLLASQLISEVQPSYDTTQFAVARFKEKSIKANL